MNYRDIDYKNYQGDIDLVDEPKQNETKRKKVLHRDIDLEGIIVEDE